jgi:hypothetical protein
VPIDVSRDVYASVRNAIVYLAGQYYETHGHLTFVHRTTMRERTVRDEFDKVAVHNALHLGHIRAALAR